MTMYVDVTSAILKEEYVERKELKEDEKNYIIRIDEDDDDDEDDNDSDGQGEECKKPVVSNSQQSSVDSAHHRQHLKFKFKSK